MKRFFNNIVVKFILITLVFFIITSPIVVLFGPFGNLKRAVVGAIMRSRHPQYITWLYDQEELNQILGTVTTTDKQNVFAFKPRTDATLKLKKIETSRFVGYLLEIPNPKRIEVATAEDINEKGDTTSSIAKKNNAVAAINGGGFYDPNGTGIGRLPYGFILHQGKYLLGQQVDDKEKVDFVGMTKDGTMLFLVIDGRKPGYSIGATLVDSQNILYENGAYIAANLDGGSSTTLYYNGKVVNKPADLLGERMIPTAFIVK